MDVASHLPALPNLCRSRDCQPIEKECTSTGQCCTADPLRTGDVQCLSDICTQPAVSGKLRSAPAGHMSGLCSMQSDSAAMLRVQWMLV